MTVDPFRSNDPRPTSLADRSSAFGPASPPSNRPTRAGPLRSAGLLLGVGMGGFVDGILFHQILQVHSMLSARRPPDTVVNLEINMVWDGLFHAFTWATTLVGIVLLFRAGRRSDVPWSGRLLAGAMLFGWGLFNLAEGIIDHHILHVHHVYERAGGVSVWDWVFLASGVVLMLAGGWLMRRPVADLPARG